MNERPARDSVCVGGVLYQRGDRVRLRPRGNADAFDVVLRGMTAVVEAIEVDREGRVYLSVTIEDDPGRDLGVVGKPAHRFYYGPEEVEWLGPAPPSERAASLPRSQCLLIAGVGNLFLGDDGFGVEVVRRLASRPQPEGVRVIDFGIRGFDLACALTSEYGGAILVDAMSRGEPPGTLFVVEPEVAADAPAEIEAHGLTPEKVLRLARALGEVCPWLRLVGCEPLTFGSEDEPATGLSAPVAAAVDEAVRTVEALARNYLSNDV